MVSVSVAVVSLAVILIALINIPETPNEDAVRKTYEQSTIVSPVLSGFPLRLFSTLIEYWPTNRIFSFIIWRDSQFALSSILSNKYPNVPLQFYPIPQSGIAKSYQKPTWTKLSFEKRTPNPGFNFKTSIDYYHAYKQSQLTPLEAAEKIIQLMKDSDKLNPPLHAIIAFNEDDIISQAKASTERWKKGSPLGPLDGVPVLVKDEIDAAGYKNYAGTKFLGDIKGPSKEDATIVKRMKDQGAIIMGKTNMHELGMGVTGSNIHWGVSKNAYNVNHYPGGSSSGCGVAIGTGMVPICLGSDAGGSIRIPSAFNGIVGLKATFARISDHGSFPNSWTVGHLGPMGSTVLDIALTYLATAGPDSKELLNPYQPDLDFTIDEMLEKIPKGLKVGVFWPWVLDSSLDMITGFNKTLRLLETKLDMTIVPVEIPYLEAIDRAYTITTVVEMVAGAKDILLNNRGDLSSEARSNLAFGETISGTEYVHAQKVRSFGFKVVTDLFENVDILVTPSTGMTAPLIPDAEFSGGVVDTDQLFQIMHFAQFGNFFGLPALTVPVGYGGNGLPIGFQIMAKHWNEKLVLKVGNAIESLIERRMPSGNYFSVLP